MRIAIDLNDVVRDYSNNFVKYYLEGYDHEYDLSDFEFWSNDMSKVFPFNSPASYHDFIYNNYAFELYGKCPVCTRKLEAELNDWTEKIIPNIDTDENVELLFVSTKEYGQSIGNTYFFISKLGSKIRETYFPENSIDIWDKCDVLITANPLLIDSKPQDKICVKIKFDYNNESEGDFTYSDLSSFLKESSNTEKLIEKFSELSKKD